MTKKDLATIGTLLTVVVVLGLISFAQYNWFGTLNITGAVISDLIVFLSILFGFCATSLAIFSTSRYMGDLYHVEDPKDNARTMLHVLISRYQFGLLCAIISILYFLILEIYLANLIVNSIALSNALALPIAPIVALNFYFGLSLLNILSKVVIQEGMRNGRK